jgi:high frequency lysogenization protein
MTNIEEQILALSGVFQCCVLVDQIAQNGQCDESELAAMLETLFVKNPPNTASIYPKPELQEKGFAQLESSLTQTGDRQDALILRYALALMHLQHKLAKQPDMLQTLGSRLERAEQQKEHFSITHENVIASLASIYQDTISTFSTRIQVAGHANHLQVERNAAKIRALLLAGIRSATLWRQVGGHRWHFIFKKSKITNTSKMMRTTLPQP